MSYILSALKKSTEERKRGEVPNLLTTTNPQKDTAIGVEVQRRPGKSYFVFVGFVVLVFIAAWVVFLMRSSGEGGFLSVSSKREAVPAPAQTRTLPAEMQAPQSPRRAGTAPPQEVLQTPPETPPVRPVPPPVMDKDLYQSANILEYSQLPQEVQERLPALRLSGHFYSEKQPRIRKVIINDNTVREDQYIAPDLLVTEIISNGVILQYQDVVFKIYTDQIFQ